MNSVSDFLASFFFPFCNDSLLILSLFVIGFIWLDKSTFYQAGCLLLISILLNFVLKGIFHIQVVAPHSNFAFPSGHMQCATVLYCWLASKTPGLFWKTITAVLLAGIGMSLVHFHYHTMMDVAGGLFFGLALLKVWSLVSNKFPESALWLLLLAASLLMLPLAFLYPQIPVYSWKTYYLLSGAILLPWCIKLWTRISSMPLLQNKKRNQAKNYQTDNHE